MFPTWDERPLVIADGSDSANNYVYTPADYTTFKNVWQEPKFKVYEQGIGTNTTPQGAAQRSSVLIPEESSFGLKRDASGNPVAGAPTPTVLRAYHVGKAIELISKRFYNKTAKHNKLTLLLSINDARRFDTFGSINGITTTQRATENIYIPKGDTSENGMVNFRTAPVRVFVDTVMGTIKVMHTPDIGLTRGNPLSYAVAPLAWDAPELVTRGGYALLIDFEDFAVCTNPASQFDLRIEGDQGDYVNIVRGGKYSFQTYSPYITMICNLAV
jgi:hypothetical protein